MLFDDVIIKDGAYCRLQFI